MKFDSCSFSFTGGPVSHQVLNVCAQQVAENLNKREISCLGLTRGITPILNGFRTRNIIELSEERFEAAQTQSHSVLQTERFLPRRTRTELQSVIRFLLSKRVGWDICTGGDGTFITKLHMARANRVLRNMGNGLKRMVQIPRTMDGDFIKAEFDLGFATALHHGIQALRAFEGDASIYGGPTVTRMMGRNEGVYALHCASGFGAKMCLVPEEFEQESVDHLKLVDALVAHILLVLLETGAHTQILIAEGFWNSLSRQSQNLLGMERCGADEHFRIDFKASPAINAALAEAIESRLQQLGVSEFGMPIPVQQRAVGYAERQREAVKADLELATELGAWAVELALSDDRKIPDAVVALPNREWLAFEDIENDGDRVISPEINTRDPLFQASLSSQRWLQRADLENPDLLARLSRLTNLNNDEFREEFTPATNFFQHRNNE